MFRKFYSISTVGKIFTILSLIIGVGYIVVYIHEVIDALQMDPHSYNCMQDSMMKHICADPFGSSMTWAAMVVIAIGWPLIIIWVVVGITLLILRRCRLYTTRTKA